MVKRLLPSVLLIVAVTSPLLAGPREDLARLVRDATNSPEPTTAVFQGFASLPDFTLDGASVEAALRAGGAPTGGVVSQVLGGLTNVTKSGGAIEMQRARPAVIPIVVNGETKGAVGLDPDVTFAINRQGSGASVDNPTGIKVGTSAADLYDLKKLAFTEENGKPVVTLTAGWLMFEKTVRFELPAAKKKPVATADPGLPPPVRPKPRPVATTAPTPKPPVALATVAPAASATAPQATPRGPGIVQALAHSPHGQTPSPAEVHPLLARGARGKDVLRVQKLLNAKTRTLAEDGLYGPETEAAVADFQRRHHCVVDGMVGPETWAALLRAPAKPAKPAAR